MTFSNSSTRYKPKARWDPRNWFLLAQSGVAALHEIAAQLAELNEKLESVDRVALSELTARGLRHG